MAIQSSEGEAWCPSHFVLHNPLQRAPDFDFDRFAHHNNANDVTASCGARALLKACPQGAPQAARPHYNKRWLMCQLWLMPQLLQIWLIPPTYPMTTQSDAGSIRCLTLAAISTHHMLVGGKFGSLKLRGIRLLNRLLKVCLISLTVTLTFQCRIWHS